MEGSEDKRYLVIHCVGLHMFCCSCHSCRPNFLNYANRDTTK